jgi:hypothetical protein
VKYLCLVYHDEKALDALPECEHDALIEEFREYRDDLQTSGHFVASDMLQPVRMATTIRVRHGKVALWDGPFAETKEQLGGFVLIEARDLNEAIRVAAKMPLARLGCVDVRPIQEIGAR